MESLSSYSSWLIAWLKLHPHAAGIFTFLISFGESLAIVGTIIPGSFSMTAIGVLIGSGIVPCYSTYAAAIIGAIAGDYVSYYLGYCYHKQIINCWPFSRYPNLIQRGKDFFNQHGKKSIFLGRFLGPLRSIIPLIAGMMLMPQRDFLIPNVTSAVAWSVAYICPGVLIGSAASELGTAAVSGMLLTILGLILISWLFGWCYQLLRKKVADMVAAAQKCSNTENKVLWWLIDHRHCITPVLLAMTFAGFSWLRVHDGWTTYCDKPIFHLLQSLHGPTLTQAMVLISLSGEKLSVLLTACIMVGFLAHQKAARQAMVIAGTTVFSGFSVFVLKKAFAMPRPPMLGQHGFSYPSGHVALSACVYGLLCLLLCQSVEATNRQFLIKPMACYLIAIAFSRLYLGAHWLSDVTGAALLAATIVSAVFPMVNRYSHLSQATPQRLPMSASALMLATAINALIQPQLLLPLQPIPPQVKQLHYQAWWQNPAHLPTQRSNRFGSVSSPLNVQWAMPKHGIEQVLQTNHWTLINHHLWAIRFQHAFFSKDRRVAWLRPLLNHQPPAIVAVRQPFILRLWSTPHGFKDSTTPLWLGTLSLLKDESRFGMKRSTAQINAKQLQYASPQPLLQLESKIHRTPSVSLLVIRPTP